MVGVASSSHTGVLLMAYGSPDTIDELEPYLLDIRGGRPVSPQLLAEMSERYRLIGGRSPLLDITGAQASALEVELKRRLSPDELPIRTYVGMRHWEPRIRRAVAQMQADGIVRVIGLVMAPHTSRLSTDAYFERLRESIAQEGANLEVIPIGAWHDHPGLIAALAENARAALSRFPNGEAYVIFSAHSLPARILAEGDGYADQLHRTASLVARSLGLVDGTWEFCYQSAGKSPEPWLGPSIEDRIPELARAGRRNLLVVPIGFVCDHVEILYDIDIAARRLAASEGAHLERSASLNTDPMFISALADLVLGKVVAPAH